MQTDTEKMRQMSRGELASLGMHHVAYIRDVEYETDEGSGEGVAIYAADGTQVALMPDREHARAVLIQNDLEPVSVH